MKLLEKLRLIQVELKAPKNQRNTFGNYNYRSCEDILEAVKPLLAFHCLTLTITDEVINIGNRYYVKATANLQEDTESKSVSSMARESETKKGMDESQITGSCSSYARKYALNGLFLIDDTKDADTMDNTDKEEKNTNRTQLSPFVRTDKKTTIANLLKKKFTGKLQSVEDYKEACIALTGFELLEANYDTIINQLK